MSPVKIVIGIDIGIAGAIAVITEENMAIELYKMPVIVMELEQEREDGNPQTRTIYDEKKIKNLFVQLQKTFEIITVCIERPIAMPRQTILTAANTFEGFGFLKGLMEGLQINYGTVMPAAWTKTILNNIKKIKGEKASIFKKRKKARSIKEAKRLHPKMRSRIGTDDNFADALLIAKWAMQRLKKVKRVKIV